MKKICAVLVCVFIVLTAFCSCENYKKNESPLAVNGTPIDGEIFKYYLDEAFSKAETQTQDGRIEYATTKCIRYVATNSTFAQKGLSLSSADSAVLSDEGNALWNIFKEHYEALGISKQTFMKIRTNAAYTEKLRLALYDTNGTSPIPDEQLKAYFSSAYVAFKLVRGYLFTTDAYGNRVEYTEDELNAITKKYNNAASQINGKTSIEYVYPLLVTDDGEIEQSLKTEVISTGNPYYPEGFFEKVQTIKPDTAAVCIFGDYIYLVYRLNILSDSELFKNYRSTCLKEVSEIPLQNEINLMCNAYTSVRRMSVVKDYYSEVKKLNRENS